MHEDQLLGLYKDSSKEGLLRAWKLAEDYESKANALERKADTVKNNVCSTIAEHFKDCTEKEFHKIGEVQIEEMSKQWRLMSASMVTVQRTVKLPGFHSRDNMAVNKRYGIKELKRYSGWQPFHIYDLRRMAASMDDSPFYVDGSILRMGNNEHIDFSVLDRIPQLDQERVKMLAGITHDTVQLIDSWLDFFGNTNKSMMEDYEIIVKITDRYSRLDSDKWPEVIRRLDKLKDVRDTIQASIEAQANKWRPTLEKWRARNKNFVVLNELAKSDLRI